MPESEPHSTPIYSQRLAVIYTMALILHKRYDTWGRRRNPDDWSYDDVPTSHIFDRGFTGHQHLDQFGLINMLVRPKRNAGGLVRPKRSGGGNGRVYDPILGRFLSPDPIIQSPGNPQNYNRYSYALNNPLKYTDPSGEFFVWDSWLAGLFSGGLDEANNRVKNDIKIWGGLFAADTDQSGWGWQIVSRLTWELPQTLGGLVTAHSYNTFGLSGGVESVDYAYGATTVQTRDDDYFGLTQGSFIVGSKHLEADANNPLFQHEYGHYLQSQSMGWAYYPTAGIPSLRSAKKDGQDPNYEHDFHLVEQDANRRAFLFFNERVEGFQHDSELTNQDYRDNKGWDFYRNPLNIDGSNTRMQYLDYQNQNQVHELLEGLILRPKWYDYASWLFLPCGGPYWASRINADI